MPIHYKNSWQPGREGDSLTLIVAPMKNLQLTSSLIVKDCFQPKNGNKPRLLTLPAVEITLVLHNFYTYPSIQHYTSIQHYISSCH